MALVIAMALGQAAMVAAECAGDLDCQLNGLCKSGTCQCDAQWYGPNCELLALLPTAPANGLQPPNASTWGGSIIRGDDGKIHMFAAYMTENCGLTSWETNSEVVHAVADSPLGPFSIQETVLKRFAHNPTIHKVGDEYLLFHIGCSATEEPCTACKKCTNGTTPPALQAASRMALSGGDSCNGPHWTGLHTSKSLDGPWEDQGEVTIQTTKPSNATWITNPCTVALTNGTVLNLYRQAGTVWPHSASTDRERLGFAVAQACPSGVNCSYIDHTAEYPILNASLEDQYMWVDRRGNLHALTHKNGAGGVSGHLFSADGGRSWSISSVAPYNTSLPLVGGGTHECGKRARPMLIVENGVPLYLSTGASYGRGSDHTFTSMQRIQPD